MVLFIFTNKTVKKHSFFYNNIVKIIKKLNIYCKATIAKKPNEYKLLPHEIDYQQQTGGIFP